jgi:hypothetical protein
MAISRRKFLTAGTIAAFYAGVPLKALANRSFGAANRSISSIFVGSSAISATSYLSRKSFSSCLNTSFSLSHGDETNVVKLIEVNDLSRGKEKIAAGSECFSLLFVGPKNIALRQNTYSIEHDSLGSFAALIVPLGKGKRGNYYEAVFNRSH